MHSPLPTLLHLSIPFLYTNISQSMLCRTNGQVVRFLPSIHSAFIKLTWFNPIRGRIGGGRGLFHGSWTRHVIRHLETPYDSPFVQKHPFFSFLCPPVLYCPPQEEDHDARRGGHVGQHHPTIPEGHELYWNHDLGAVWSFVHLLGCPGCDWMIPFRFLSPCIL